MILRWFFTCTLLLTVLLAQDGTELRLAQEYFMDGEYEKALPLYEKLQKQIPDNPQLLTRVVECYLALKQPQEALTFIDRNAKRSPSPTVLALKGFVYQEQAQRPQAEAEWQKSIDACKTENDYRQLGNYFLGIREFTFAEKSYLAGQQKLGGAGRFALELSYVYRYQNQYTSAVKALVTYYEAEPGMAAMVRSQILSMAQEPAYRDDVEAGLLQSMTRLGNDRELPQWLYDFYLQIENYDEALRQAKALDKRFSEQGRRLYDLGMVLQNNELYKQSNQALSVIITEQPTSPFYVEALTQQAKNLELMAFESQPLDTAALHQAVTNYDALLARYGRNAQMREVLYRKARLCAFYLQQQELALRELSFIEQLPIAPGEKAEARLLLGDVLLMRGERLKAELQYKQVLEDFKEDQVGAQARFRQARLLYFTGQFEEAKTYLKILKERTENDISNDAIRLFLTIQDNIGLDTTTTALERYAHAELLLYQEQTDAALLLLDSILFAYPNHELTDDIYYSKATIYLRRSDETKALEYLDRVLQQYPTGIMADDALFAKAELYHFRRQDTATAQKLYMDLLIGYPASLYKVEARKRIRQLRNN